jgi:hypothetical protein
MVRVLALNPPDRVELRAELIAAGVFPLASLPTGRGPAAQCLRSKWDDRGSTQLGFGFADRSDRNTSEVNMNKYFTDAIYWLKRVAVLLDDVMTQDQLNDAIIYFAFGVEKIFKAVLWDVNPLFLLEKPVFENACPALYMDKMHEKAKEKAGKEHENKKVNMQVLPFQGSMIRAATFSRAIEASIGAFTHLAGFARDPGPSNDGRNE